MRERLKNALITAVIAGTLALPLAGVRTGEGGGVVTVQWQLGAVAVAVMLVFVGRLGWELAGEGRAAALLAVMGGVAALVVPMPSLFLKTAAVGIGGVVGIRFVFARFILRLHRSRADGDTFLGGWFRGSRWIPACAGMTRRGAAPEDQASLSPQAPTPYPRPRGAGESQPRWRLFASSIAAISRFRFSLTKISYLLIALAIIFPLTPLANRYALDVAIMVLTYVMLAWGLNLTVGYAGLLDLGYAGFYALGAYGYALLAQRFGWGFWQCLPLAGGIAALTGLVLGAPVLRLRGDYFAVVTLGFGEIVRLVLINWTDLTGGPNGVSDIPRPTLFGLAFARQAPDGQRSFSDFFGVAFDPMQRVWFLYYVILGLALAVGWFGVRIRRLPLGRAWESFRVDEIACASLGINRTWIKLAAYSLSALVAGLAGAFFAASQGFVSPESFSFTESATILAIVILGGIGHPLGIVLAAMFIIGMPELFRGFEQYRMIAFGLGMVMIMVWRPGGMMAVRQPTVKLADHL